MQSAIINFTTEEKTKKEAQEVAKKMGISLSLVLNNYLKDFVKNKKVVFSTREEKPSKWLIKALKQSEADVKAGRIISFNNPKEEFDYLDREIEDEKRRISSH